MGLQAIKRGGVCVFGRGWGWCGGVGWVGVVGGFGFGFDGPKKWVRPLIRTMQMGSHLIPHGGPTQMHNHCKEGYGDGKVYV